MSEAKRAQAEVVELLVRLGASREGGPWRAVVVHRKGGQRREFTTATAFLLYLERLCRVSGGRAPGLCRRVRHGKRGGSDV
ncbi:hypothetical protein ACKLNZ_00750 [Thermus scotoductus]